MTQLTGRSEEEDRNANEGNHCRRRRGIADIDAASDDGDKELASQHTQSAINEKWTTAEALNSPERYRS